MGEGRGQSEPQQAAPDIKDHPHYDLATGKLIAPPEPKPVEQQQEAAPAAQLPQQATQLGEMPGASGLSCFTGGACGLQAQSGLPDHPDDPVSVGGTPGFTHAGQPGNEPIPQPVPAGAPPTDLHHKMVDLMHKMVDHHAGATPEQAPTQAPQPAEAAPASDLSEMGVHPHAGTPSATEGSVVSPPAPPSKPPSTPPVAQAQPDQPKRPTAEAFNTRRNELVATGMPRHKAYDQAKAELGSPPGEEHAKTATPVVAVAE